MIRLSAMPGDFQGLHYRLHYLPPPRKVIWAKCDWCGREQLCPQASEVKEPWAKADGVNPEDTLYREHGWRSCPRLGSANARHLSDEERLAAQEHYCSTRCMVEHHSEGRRA